MKLKNIFLPLIFPVLITAIIVGTIITLGVLAASNSQLATKNTNYQQVIRNDSSVRKIDEAIGEIDKILEQKKAEEIKKTSIAFLSPQQ